MSQTDSIAYVPILWWFIILFLLFYFVVFTKILYNIIVIYKVRCNLYDHYILSFNNLISYMIVTIQNIYLLSKLEQSVIFFWIYNLIYLNIDFRFFFKKTNNKIKN